LNIICSLLQYPPDLLDIYVREIHSNSDVHKSRARSPRRLHFV